MRQRVGSKCKALSHGRAMYWPVKGRRTSGKAKPDIYIYSIVIIRIIIQRDGSGPIRSRFPKGHRFVILLDAYKRIRSGVMILRK